jgi:hypothetical protein
MQLIYEKHEFHVFIATSDHLPIVFYIKKFHYNDILNKFAFYTA